MRLVKYVICMCAVTAMAMLLFEGCGVDSGSRDYSAPGSGTPPPTGGPAHTPGSNPADAAADEQAVFNMVNTERETAGVSPLQWCDGLAECARSHSCDMCDRGFFSHTNPEGEGPSERAQRGHAGSYTFDPIVPNPYAWVGENIAWGQKTAADVMDAWMHSPGHRANILRSSYTHVGVGVCNCSTRHWTQNFGTR